MKLAVFLYGLLTAAIIVGFSVMVCWNVRWERSDDVASGIFFSMYVVSAWLAAFLLAAHRPSPIRLHAMVIGSFFGAVVLGWEYFNSIYGPTNSTAVLSLAVLPVYQWMALLGVFALVRRRERHGEN